MNGACLTPRLREVVLLNHEWGGFVCQVGPNRYRLSDYVTSHDPGSVDMNLASCGAAVTVADFHAHTNDGEPYPSGILNPNAVRADTIRANQHPELTFYLKARKEFSPPTVTRILKYQALPPDRLAQNNMYERVGDEWVYFPRPTP
jgi:hypothetical protein